MNTNCDDRIAYLQSEIDHYQEAEARRTERENREERDRFREREEHYRQAERQADDWPEALLKNAMLCQREAMPTGDEDDATQKISEFFAQSARACESAIEIWRAVE